MATIQHPSLGIVRGKATDDGSGITQFLGIKYASLEDRFAPPELVKGDAAKGVDAREFGPHVICPPDALDIELGFIQQTLPAPPAPPMSDTEGLNLNITVPPTSVQKPAGGFPVLFFIHGGGLAIGANWWPQYDFKRLVKFGVERGMPFIGVNVGYRLGIPGFLTSTEMQQAGYKPNNGLRDQATALLWIKDNIAGFGGDPSNVTAMGSSAGGASVLLHLQSPTPLFTRLISMAGTPLLMQPLPPQIADHTYTTLTTALNLTHLSPTDRITALKTLPIETLLATAPQDLPLIFVADDPSTTPHTPTFSAIFDDGESDADAEPQGVVAGEEASRKWHPDLLAGYNTFDANILTQLLPALSSPSAAISLATSLRASLPPGLAQRIVDAYGIPEPPELEAKEAKVEAKEAEAETKEAKVEAKEAKAEAKVEPEPAPEVDANAAEEEGQAEEGEEEEEAGLEGILAFATDLLFRAPARAYVDAWPPSAHAWFYAFDLRNRWEGRWRGRAAHVLDVAVLFGNFEEEGEDGEVEKGYKEGVRKWKEEMVGFAVGRGAGWREGGAEVRVFGEGGKEVVERGEEMKGDRLMGVLKGEEGVGVEGVVEAWGAFMRGE